MKKKTIRVLNLRYGFYLFTVTRENRFGSPRCYTCLIFIKNLNISKRFKYIIYKTNTKQKIQKIHICQTH